MAESKLKLSEALTQASASQKVGNLIDAKRLCKAILDVKPDHLDALHLLSVVEYQHGNYENALHFVDKALVIKADYAEALNTRGITLSAFHRTEEAVETYNRALAVKPDFAEAYNNRGKVLTDLKRPQDALASFEKAIWLRPDFAIAYYNQGIALLDLLRPSDALASFERAIALKAEFPQAENNRGIALLKLGRPELAVASYEKALAIEPNPTIHSGLIFALNFLSSTNMARQQAERRRWDALYAQQFSSSIKPHKNDCNPDRRLRIGYVSSHFRYQASTYAFGGVLLNHDPTCFEVVCYSDTRDEDEVTTRLRARSDKWYRTVGLSDDQFADLVRSDGIDILVDCVGHMAGHRLLVFARKPAPIQVTAWGEPTGTGLKTMDYLLADPVLVPASMRAQFVETVFDIPNFLSYWTPDPLPEPVVLPAIANGYVTFGSFNRMDKIQEPVLRSWAAMLRVLANARLVIKGDRWLADTTQGADLLAIFGDEGISPERVTLLEPSDRASHFAAYQKIDIALDPFPHGGGMTTLDALWMGVPVVTWAGGTISSRLAAASLTKIGLTDFIASDLDTYVSTAVAKAADVNALARLRGSLRHRLASSEIGDPIRYTRAVETAYRQMWKQWCTTLQIGPSAG